MSDLCSCSAVELARMLRDREVSATEVMQAHLTRTASLNSQLNAIVTLVADLALAKAKEADTALLRGDHVGPLHGLPVAHKDLFLTKGLRTTFGSPIFKSFIEAYEKFKCDKCGAQEFLRRSDDKPGTVRSRLVAYREQTAPIIPFYSDKGVLQSIDGMGTVEEVFDKINEIVAGG